MNKIIQSFFLSLLLCTSIFFFTVSLSRSSHQTVKTQILYNPSSSYGQMPITPSTWAEVEFTYLEFIHGKTCDGKPCQGSVKLLRPTQWLKQAHLDQPGNVSRLTIPEFGITHALVTVTSVKPTTINSITETSVRGGNNNYVIGIFKRHSTDVRQYRFIDAAGNESTVNATPNHPFYVKNKATFVPISQVHATDALLGKDHQTVHLICKGNAAHCGLKLNHHQQPMAVYNLEVRQAHQYAVGTNEIRVHNICAAAFMQEVRAAASKILSSNLSKKALGRMKGVSQGIYIAKDGTIERTAVYTNLKNPALITAGRRGMLTIIHQGKRSQYQIDISRVEEYFNRIDAEIQMLSNQAFNLHPTMRLRGENLFKQQPLSIHHGTPLTHAETLVENQLLHIADRLGGGTRRIATYKLIVHGNAAYPVGGPFPACPHCQAVILYPTEILTGIVP